jgi:putative intracellular protease/amidase
MRTNKDALHFITDFFKAGKPVAAMDTNFALD